MFDYMYCILIDVSSCSFALSDDVGYLDDDPVSMLCSSRLQYCSSPNKYFVRQAGYGSMLLRIYVVNRSMLPASALQCK
jgi:hypothetical protein